MASCLSPCSIFTVSSWRIHSAAFVASACETRSRVSVGRWRQTGRRANRVGRLSLATAVGTHRELGSGTLGHRVSPCEDDALLLGEPFVVRSLRSHEVDVEEHGGRWNCLLRDPRRAGPSRPARRTQSRARASSLAGGPARSRMALDGAKHRCERHHGALALCRACGSRARPVLSAAGHVCHHRIIIRRAFFTAPFRTSHPAEHFNTGRSLTT